MVLCLKDLRTNKIHPLKLIFDTYSRSKDDISQVGLAIETLQTKSKIEVTRLQTALLGRNYLFFYKIFCNLFCNPDSYKRLQKRLQINLTSTVEV